MTGANTHWGGPRRRKLKIDCRSDIGYSLIWRSTDDLTPQALTIVQLIAEELKTAPMISEPRLRAVLEKAKMAGILKTKQDSWRIFRFYESSLIRIGILEQKPMDPLVVLHEQIRKESEE